MGWLKKPGKKRLSRKERLALPPEKRRPVGRPPGIHTPHRTPQERRAYLVEKYGSPVEFMLSAMADKKNKKHDRWQLAKDVAPYVEHKLQTIELTGDADKPVMVQQDLSKMSDAELTRHYSALIAAGKKGK